MTYMVGIAATVMVMCHMWSNHGVHVAGIVSAVTDNSKGVASVARNAKIASIKIFNSSGKSTLSYIIEGINYAKKNDINIINCSFGGAGWGSTSVSIVKSAIEAVPDIFFVIAAGNIATSTPQADNDQSGSVSVTTYKRP